MPTALPARIAWAVEHLDLSRGAHALEIGCGAGHALGLIVARLTTGSVTGLALMFSSTCLKTEMAIRGRAIGGTLQLRLGNQYLELSKPSD